MTGDNIISLLEKSKYPLSFVQIQKALPEYSKGRLNQILHRLVAGKYIYVTSIPMGKARKITPTINTCMQVYFVAKKTKRKSRIKKPEDDNEN